MTDMRMDMAPPDLAGAGLPLAEFDGPETGDVEIAAPQFTADAIRRNYWDLRKRRKGQNQAAMFEAMSQSLYGDPKAYLAKGGAPGATQQQVNTGEAKLTLPVDAMFADMARLRATTPGDFANFPTSRADLDARAEAQVRLELQEELAEADGQIANRSDPNLTGGIASFVGSAGASLTDVEGIALLPLGFGTGPLARTILMETALGGASEAITLPAYNAQADYLGEARPDPVANILAGMTFGAALPIAGRTLHVAANAVTPAGRVRNADLLGLARRPEATATERGAGAVLGRQEATLDTAPEGIDPDTHAARVDAAERALLDDAPQTVSTTDVIPELDMTGPKAAPEPDPDASPFATEASTRALDDVTVIDSTAGKVRSLPLADSFMASLRASVAPLGDDIGVKIVSGAQPAKGTMPGSNRRTGSTRHDVDATGVGHTADVVLTRNGQDVMPGDDPELYARFLYQAARTYPGIGHYAWGVHVGGGSVASWGPDRTSATLDPTFKSAIDAGRGLPAPKGAPPRFEYEPGGNAAPDANQVGYVFGKLVDKGLPPHVAAGLMGNLMQESGRGLNTGAIGDGGNSIGMGQWNKSRAVALKDFAEGRGADWRDLDTQVEFLWSELNGSHADAMARIMAAPDAATAARIASEEFWRPSQPHLSNRMAYARMVDSQYQSGTVPQGAAPGRWREPGDDALATDVQSFPPMDLQADGAAYQYKMGGDASGITDRLLSERVWDARAAVGVMVHERLDGSRFIADGHQRLGLAKRFAAEGQDGITLQGFLLREADGWSVEDVRTLAALKNIRAESGTALDAARVMRDSPELVNQIGGRSRPFMAQAQSLADLAPGPFQAIVNEVIPQNWGAIVGRVIPDDDQLQGLAIAALKKADPQNEVQAESIARDIRRLGLEARADDAQGSLFGDGFDLRRTVISERAKVIDRVIKDARADRTLFGRLEREADTIEGAGNVLDRNENLSRAEIAEATLARVLILADQPGPVRDAIDAAARAIRGGTGLDDAARSVRDVLGGKPAKDTGRADAAGSGGTGDAPADLEPDVASPNLLDLPPVGDARIEPGLFDDPIEDLAEARRLDALDRELTGLMADPAFDLDLPLGTAASDGSVQSLSLRATLDTLREDADFADAIKTICFTKGT